MAAAYKKRMNQSPMETLMGIYDPYRRKPTGPSLPATGLRFAPSEVGLSLGRQNLDHNSTNSTLRQIPSCSLNKKNFHPEHIKETKYLWRQIASWATQLSQLSLSKAQT
jgi:hypothetical protein